MSPVVQRWLVIAAMLLAALYLAWRVRGLWRAWRAASRARTAGGCGPGCGC